MEETAENEFFEWQDPVEALQRILAFRYGF